jgi:hypothetical protein
MLAHLHIKIVVQNELGDVFKVHECIRGKIEYPPGFSNILPDSLKTLIGVSHSHTD